VPVIVTTSHYSTDICIQRNRHAHQFGAAMVMVLPPYHGATIRCPEAAVHEYFSRLSDASDIPIMVQDAPISGTPLSAESLARMAMEIEQIAY
ncbi:dihydrodipicolinate synthase family protein, partial [Methylobacterium nigriterrae]|uniref:dihydrodipicolinate synthase family protein n=1 Tax=Methylobacterium nigriterrae TaxID=3127512 RepID=UPI003013D2A1